MPFCKHILSVKLAKNASTVYTTRLFHHDNDEKMLAVTGDLDVERKSPPLDILHAIFLTAPVSTVQRHLQFCIVSFVCKIVKCSGHFFLTTLTGNLIECTPARQLQGCGFNSLATPKTWRLDLEVRSPSDSRVASRPQGMGQMQRANFASFGM